MSVFANSWRDWATLNIGIYLLFSPWIFGISRDAPSSGNAWLMGISLILVTLWALLAAGARVGELIRVGIGVWLLASPLALGFTDSSMAYSAWITGALVLGLTSILNLAFDMQNWLREKRLGHRARTVSPESIISYEHSGDAMEPESLSRQIVERSYQIYRTLQSRPSDVEAQMCALGYRACADDMITLCRLVDKELLDAGPVRQLRLKMLRNRTAYALSRARTALPRELRRSSLHGNGIT